MNNILYYWTGLITIYGFYKYFKTVSNCSMENARIFILEDQWVNHKPERNTRPAVIHITALWKATCIFIPIIISKIRNIAQLR